MHFQKAKRLAGIYIDHLWSRDQIVAAIETGRLRRDVTSIAFSDRGLKRFALRMLGIYRSSILAIERVKWDLRQKIIRLRLVCKDDIVFPGPFADRPDGGFQENCACFIDLIFSWRNDDGWSPMRGMLTGTLGRHGLMRLLERGLPDSPEVMRMADPETLRHARTLVTRTSEALSETGRLHYLSLLSGAKEPAGLCHVGQRRTQSVAGSAFTRR